MSRTLMLSPERVRRTIVRLAYEVIEENKGEGNLLFMGIRQGGIELAHALAKNIPYVESDLAEDVYELDVTAFRDDIDRSQHPGPVEGSSAVDVTGKHVVLVDDVLFTGRTARAAMDAVISMGRPRTIKLVVLIDRGHRELPIEPSFVGKKIKTKHKERVIVEVEDAAFHVYVEE